MRPRTLALAVLTAVTVLAGCGDDADSEDRAGQEPTDTTADTAQEGDAGASGDAGSLGDDVAAVVDGEEISAASIEGYIEDFTTSPGLAEQFEGEDGEAARAQLGAQILSSAIQSSVLVSGAEELDAPVTEEDIAAARAQVEEQAGGPEGLQAAMEQQGLSEDLLQLELRGVAAVQNITDALDEAAGDDGSAETTPDEVEEGAELTPSEQRVQEHLLELATTAEIQVHPDFGRWDPQTGQVLPPGS